MWMKRVCRSTLGGVKKFPEPYRQLRHLLYLNFRGKKQASLLLRAVMHI
jgi:hypothetical protein